MTKWLLDVTIGHDPVWVPVGTFPDGSVGAIVTSSQLRLPIGEKPEGEVFGIWHQDGHHYLQEWLASEDAKPWRAWLQGPQP